MEGRERQKEREKKRDRERVEKRHTETETERGRESRKSEGTEGKIKIVLVNESQPPALLHCLLHCTFSE